LLFDHDADDDLDFDRQKHNHRQQEDKTFVHLVPPFDEPAGPVPAGLLLLILIDE
jgi:hypothetical protein